MNLNNTAPNSTSSGISIGRALARSADCFDSAERKSLPSSNDSARIRASSGHRHVTKMATIGFRFRFRAAVCLLAAMLLWTSAAEESLKPVDGWSLPDSKAAVGKLFRYRVTSHQLCAEHYKVYSTSIIVLSSISLNCLRSFRLLFRLIGSIFLSASVSFCVVHY